MAAHTIVLNRQVSRLDGYHLESLQPFAVNVLIANIESSEPFDVYMLISSVGTLGISQTHISTGPCALLFVFCSK